MNRFTSFIIASVAVVSAFAMTGTADAAERPNILIMGEDFDKDSIRRGSQAFNRTLNAIATEMQDAGYKVFDESAISLDDFKQGRKFRRHDELIDIAKSVTEAPIDMVIIFSIFPQIEQRPHTTRVYASVTGRMVDVNNSRRLGNFTEETRQRRNVAPDCGRDCLIRNFGSISEEFGREVGRVLTIKLETLAVRQQRSGGRDPRGLQGAYKMEFIGFHPKEITEVEEFITSFSGYQHHRVMKGSRETRKVYWYETNSDQARLDRNLRLMLEHVGIRGRIKFERNTFFVNRIAKLR